jgi:hypothetical protein
MEEDPRAMYAKSTSASMNMGSMGFSTMSSFSFNLDDDQDMTVEGTGTSGKLSSIMSMNLTAPKLGAGVAAGVGGTSGSTKSGGVHVAPLPLSMLYNPNLHPQYQQQQPQQYYLQQQPQVYNNMPPPQQQQQYQQQHQQQQQMHMQYQQYQSQSSALPPQHHAPEYHTQQQQFQGQGQGQGQGPSFMTAQQQQQLHQQYMQEQQNQANLAGQGSSNNWSPHAQHGMSSGVNSSTNSGYLSNSGENSPQMPPAAAPSLTRIGSFKSTLTPLSVDMNALNAVHQAHHQAKVLKAQIANNSSNNSSGIISVGGQSSVSSDGGSSSPERFSFNYPTQYAMGVASEGVAAGTLPPPRNRSYSAGSTGGMGGGGGAGGSGGSRAPSAHSTPHTSLTMVGLSMSEVLDSGRGSLHQRAGSGSFAGGVASGPGAGPGAAGAGSGSSAADDAANRSSKSLATISRRFVEHFGQPNTLDYISGLLDVDDVHGKHFGSQHCPFSLCFQWGIPMHCVFVFDAKLC